MSCLQQHRIGAFFLLLALCSTLFGCTPTSEQKQENPLQRKITANTTLPTLSNVPESINNVVILSEEYPPYNYTDEKGEFTGLATAQVRRALQRLNLQIPIRSYPWARAYEMAQTDPNVLIYSLVFTEERKNKFKWIYPVAPTRTYLYCLGKREDIHIQSLEDAKRYKIGIIDGYHDGEFLMSRGFEKGINLEVSSTPEVSLEKFYNGRYDIWIADNVYATYILEKTGHNMKDLRELYYIKELDRVLYLAASLGTPDEVVEQFRRAFTIDKPQ